MKFIITSGGTKERIDSVRSITNGATGRLGSLIADELSRRLSSVEHTIYYLCGSFAVVPKSGSVRIIQIEGTDDLQDKLENLLKTEQIDAVIHAMAVSDYKVKSVTAPELVSASLYEAICKSPPTKEELSRLIQEVLIQAAIPADKKISSDLEHPVLVLQKTPKIIGLIKAASPQTILVGFKLLSGVDEQVLIDTAYRLLIKNNCDYVLANDTDSIKAGNHEGFLIDAAANVTKLEGKEAIAGEIADRVLKKLLEDTK